MKLLLDTQVILWAADEVTKISKAGRTLIDDPENQVWFSVVSLWEIAIKRSVRRRGFHFEPRALRKNLLQSGYCELLVNSEHTSALENLPQIHKDPFDRMLVAQANSEALTLLTADSLLTKYPGSVRKV